jgi:hypothetical protein
VAAILSEVKVEGMIEVGFTGRPMTFIGYSFYYSSEEDIGLKQTFDNQDYGWIYGRVKISFATYGTPEEEVAVLKQLLEYINLTFYYKVPKQ